jgi:hypothetical protein
MDCGAHPGTEASGPCVLCFKNLCEVCATFERAGEVCCERCGHAAEEQQNALSSGLLALIAVAYLATLVVGTALFNAKPLVGGLAAVVAIALGRALQLLVRSPSVSRRLPGGSGAAPTPTAPRT